MILIQSVNWWKGKRFKKSEFETLNSDQKFIHVIETRQVDPRIKIKHKLSLNELIFLTQLFLSENNKTETDEFDRLLESKINQKINCSVF